MLGRGCLPWKLPTDWARSGLRCGAKRQVKGIDMAPPQSAGGTDIAITMEPVLSSPKRILRLISSGWRKV